MEFAKGFEKCTKMKVFDLILWSNMITDKGCEALAQYIYDFLMKNYNRLNVSLGEVQRLVRGDENWPQGGMPDVLAAVMAEPYGAGQRKMNSGDAYIGFVRFPKDGSLPQ